MGPATSHIPNSLNCTWENSNIFGNKLQMKVVLFLYFKQVVSFSNQIQTNSSYFVKSYISSLNKGGNFWHSFLTRVQKYFTQTLIVTFVTNSNMSVKRLQICKQTKVMVMKFVLVWLWCLVLNISHNNEIPKRTWLFVSDAITFENEVSNY